MSGTKEETRCGTLAGYRRHKKQGEKPCDACAAARSAYDRRWRAAGDRLRRSRLHARAQQKAWSALAANHKDEYDALYRAAKAALFAEAGLS